MGLDIKRIVQKDGWDELAAVLIKLPGIAQYIGSSGILGLISFAVKSGFTGTLEEYEEAKEEFEEKEREREKKGDELIKSAILNYLIYRFKAGLDVNIDNLRENIKSEIEDLIKSLEKEYGEIQGTETITELFEDIKITEIVNAFQRSPISGEVKQEDKKKFYKAVEKIIYDGDIDLNRSSSYNLAEYEKLKFEEYIAHLDKKWGWMEPTGMFGMLAGVYGKLGANLFAAGHYMDMQNEYENEIIEPIIEQAMNFHFVDGGKSIHLFTDEYKDEITKRATDEYNKDEITKRADDQATTDSPEPKEAVGDSAGQATTDSAGEVVGDNACQAIEPAVKDNVGLAIEDAVEANDGIKPAVEDNVGLAIEEAVEANAGIKPAVEDNVGLAIEEAVEANAGIKPAVEANVGQEIKEAVEANADLLSGLSLASHIGTGFFMLGQAWMLGSACHNIYKYNKINEEYEKTIDLVGKKNKDLKSFYNKLKAINEQNITSAKSIAVGQTTLLAGNTMSFFGPTIVATLPCTIIGFFGTVGGVLMKMGAEADKKGFKGKFAETEEEGEEESKEKIPKLLKEKREEIASIKNSINPSEEGYEKSIEDTQKKFTLYTEKLAYAKTISLLHHAINDDSFKDLSADEKKEALINKIKNITNHNPLFSWGKSILFDKKGYSTTKLDDYVIKQVIQNLEKKETLKLLRLEKNKANLKLIDICVQLTKEEVQIDMDPNNQHKSYDFLSEYGISEDEMEKAGLDTGEGARLYINQAKNIFKSLRFTAAESVETLLTAKKCKSPLNELIEAKAQYAGISDYVKSQG